MDTHELAHMLLNRPKIPVVIASDQSKQYKEDGFVLEEVSNFTIIKDGYFNERGDLVNGEVCRLK